MRRSLVSLAFVLDTVGCSRAPARALPPVAAPRAAAAPQPAPPQPASPTSVSACRATPSTVYGDEPVVFEIEGPGGTAPAEVELLDHAERALSWESVPVPGAWRPSDVPSGDFTLQAGSNRVRCRVTVNRELKRGPSRATETPR